MDFSGQTVLVLGGAGEIGGAAARRFAESGATVAICDADVARGALLAQSFVSEGFAALFHEVDATDPQSIADVVQQVRSATGRIDVALNAVGFTTGAPFLKGSPDFWTKMVDLNLMSAVYLCAAVLPVMEETGYGRIVLISSLAGRVGRPRQALYSATKAGVIGLMRALALEFAPSGITVNAVAPGATNTSFLRRESEEFIAMATAAIPRGIIAEPEDQASAILFLAHRDAAHITGQTLSVDGGATMI